MALFEGTIRLGDQPVRLAVFLPQDGQAAGGFEDDGPAQPARRPGFAVGLAQDGQAAGGFADDGVAHPVVYLFAEGSVPERILEAARARGLALVAALLPENPSPALLDALETQLPSLTVRLFRLDNDPDRTWVAGWGAGGYLALRCFYRHGKRYAGCVAAQPSPAPEGGPDLRRVMEDAMLEALGEGSARMPGWMYPPRVFTSQRPEDQALAAWMGERGIPVAGEALEGPWLEPFAQELALLPQDVPHPAAPCAVSGATGGGEAPTGNPDKAGSGPQGALPRVGARGCGGNGIAQPPRRPGFAAGLARRGCPLLWEQKPDK